MFLSQQYIQPAKVKNSSDSGYSVPLVIKNKPCKVLIEGKYERKSEPFATNNKFLKR